MVLDDLLFYLVRYIGPPVLLLCCVLGAAALWRSTRFVSALVQLLAASLAFVSWGFRIVRVEFTTPFDTSSFVRVLWSDTVPIIESVTLLLGIVVFVAGYLWYALTHKSI